MKPTSAVNCFYRLRPANYVDEREVARNLRRPGNVRQLQHLLERLVILSPVDTVGGEAVREALASIEPRQKRVESPG